RAGPARRHRKGDGHLALALPDGGGDGGRAADPDGGGGGQRQLVDVRAELGADPVGGVGEPVAPDVLGLLGGDRVDAPQGPAGEAAVAGRGGRVLGGVAVDHIGDRVHPGGVEGADVPADE